MRKFQALLKKTINDFKNREINAFTNAIWLGKNKQIEKYIIVFVKGTPKFSRIPS